MQTEVSFSLYPGVSLELSLWIFRGKVYEHCKMRPLNLSQLRGIVPPRMGKAPFSLHAFPSSTELKAAKLIHGRETC